MTMKKIREQFNVPAKRGMKVRIYLLRYGQWVEAMRGRITSASDEVIFVNSIGFEPRYGVVYFDNDGAILLDTRSDLDLALKNLILHGNIKF